MLIVRVGAMGDVLHALPAAAALREKQPELAIDWVVDPRWAPLLANESGSGPVVSRIHLANTRLWSKSPCSGATLRSVWGLRRALRNGRYDLVVDMQGTLRSAVIAKMAGAERVYGYRDPREAAAAYLYSERCIRGGVHIVDQGAALLGQACGAPLAPMATSLPREEWAEGWADDLVGDGRVCVLAASAGWGAKQWPAERFAALARVVRSMGFRVLVNAPKLDHSIALGVVGASNGAAELVVCNVAGLLALLRRAALVVGGDSGPVHLAAALGVPLVALFGPTDPARNGPWGSGPRRVLRDPSSVTNYKRRAEVDPGLALISVEQVTDAVAELLPS